MGLGNTVIHEDDHDIPPRTPLVQRTSVGCAWQRAVRFHALGQFQTVLADVGNLAEHLFRQRFLDAEGPALEIGLAAARGEHGGEETDRRALIQRLVESGQGEWHSRRKETLDDYRVPRVGAACGGETAAFRADRIPAHLVARGLVIEDPETAADHEIVLSEGRPGKSQARRPIVPVGVDDLFSEGHSAARADRIKNVDGSVRRGGSGDREPGMELIAQRSGQAEVACGVHNECDVRRVAECAAGSGYCQRIATSRSCSRGGH